MKVYVVILEDRLLDVQANLFSSAELAIRFAKEQVKDCEIFDDKITQAMVDDKWIYYCQYSHEGDSIWVAERIIDNIWLEAKIVDKKTNPFIPGE